MHLEWQFFILNKRWSSSLGLFYHVPSKGDQGDWDWRLRVNDTPNAIGCTCMMHDTVQESSAQRRCRVQGSGFRVQGLGIYMNASRHYAGAQARRTSAVDAKGTHSFKSHFYTEHILQSHLSTEHILKGTNSRHSHKSSPASARGFDAKCAHILKNDFYSYCESSDGYFSIATCSHCGGNA